MISDWKAMIIIDEKHQSNSMMKKKHFWNVTDTSDESVTDLVQITSHLHYIHTLDILDNC